MDRALAWIRKSKGSEDDIGLQQQRQSVTDLAHELAAEVETLDLGVQTGFSSMTRDGDGLLDDHDDVNDAVEQLRAGEYDVLVAYDDRRICRDDFSSVIEYACLQGDCEIAFVDTVPEDDLAYDIKRRVERDTKEEEIEKARRAVKERLDRGDYHGRPPFGLRFDDERRQLEPDPEEFAVATEVLSLRDSGETYDGIADRVGVSKGTVYRIVQRREEYEQYV